MTEAPHGLAGALASAMMALTFLLGDKIHPLESVVRDRRALLSFGAGVAAAYLFVGMMPELSDAVRYLESTEGTLKDQGIIVYLMALLGFVIFYGFDHWTGMAVGDSAHGASGERVFGYGLYVWLMSYVMVVEAGDSVLATLWYAFAISCHFLLIDHSLSEKRKTPYDKRGRFLLASCVVLGWLSAQVVELSAFSTALALAFVSGALTVNSVIMELSEGTRGQFIPFALGSAVYAALLLGAGMAA